VEGNKAGGERKKKKKKSEGRDPAGPPNILLQSFFSTSTRSCRTDMVAPTGRWKERERGREMSQSGIREDIRPEGSEGYCASSCWDLVRK